MSITHGLLGRFFYQLFELNLTAPIYCRESIGEQVLLNFFKSVANEKQTNPHLGQPEVEYLGVNYSFKKKLCSQVIVIKKRSFKRTKEKEAAACSSNPTKPASVKYFPEQMPSSSGDTTSSDTADSSSTLEEMFCRVRKIS